MWNASEAAARLREVVETKATEICEEWMKGLRAKIEDGEHFLLVTVSNKPAIGCRCFELLRLHGFCMKRDAGYGGWSTVKRAADTPLGERVRIGLECVQPNDPIDATLQALTAYASRKATWDRESLWFDLAEQHTFADKPMPSSVGLLIRAFLGHDTEKLQNKWFANATPTYFRKRQREWDSEQGRELVKRTRMTLEIETK
jgi:hypothetical protein